VQVKRTVFFISDGTGITAETLGHSLLTQFDKIHFTQVTLPFIDTAQKAAQAVKQINEAARSSGIQPIVFSTLVSPGIYRLLTTAQAVIFDMFDTFLGPLEQELNMRSTHSVGLTHGLVDNNTYKIRINAVNFALGNDDGGHTHAYGAADIILIGVSRTGKTPTCLYLALKFGVYAANYPLTEEDLEEARLPRVLEPYRKKLFGLTIDSERLHAIRSERQPNSRYASLKQCMLEVTSAESLYRIRQIPYVPTTRMSIEEIATRILHQANLVRRVY
jgi:Uncharacterized protein conserved in bacteria